MKVLGADDVLGCTARRVIKLSFGILYSREKFDPVESIFTAPSEDSSPSKFRPAASSQEQVWESLASSAMTAMVVMLDYIGILSNVIHAQYNSWSMNNIENVVRCLEASYHHARCFNADSDLRAKLYRKGFMRFRDNSKRRPHLVEQETSSLAQILIVAFRLYTMNTESHADAEARANFAEPLILR